MAELTNLETKLGEVIGLAMAAQDATQKVSKLVEKEGSVELEKKLKTMWKEAARAEKLASELAAGFQGKKTAIMKEARLKSKAADMMSTYLDRDADALDGFEFLTMAEASEVGHWSVLRKMSKKAGHQGVRELAKAQVAIQKRHLRDVMDGSILLAGEEDPNEPA